MIISVPEVPRHEKKSWKTQVHDVISGRSLVIQITNIANNDEKTHLMYCDWDRLFLSSTCTDYTHLLVLSVCMDQLEQLLKLSSKNQRFASLFVFTKFSFIVK